MSEMSSEAPSEAAPPSGPAAPAAPSGGRTAAIAFIYVTVVLDVLALGIVLPVLPKLVEGFLHGDTARAAQIFGLFGTVWALMQFVFSPILGALSDRFGRRRVILVSNFGLGLNYVVMALAPSLGWLFAGRVIAGITAASFTTAAAYVADVTPPERRAAGFGLIGSAFGLGFILGPAVGGLVGELGPRAPFWLAGGLTLVNAMYGLFVLPESLAKSARRPFSFKRANPIGALTLLRSQPQLLGLAGVYFLYYLAHNVLPSVFVLYAGYRYHWNNRSVGLTLALVGACSAVVQGGLVRPLVARIGERRAMIVGLACGVLGLVFYGLADRGPVFLLGVPVFAMMGLFGPAAQGSMTRLVGPSEQGQLQGANSSVQAITGLIGPGLFTQTFAYFISDHAVVLLPGAPFLLAAMVLLAAIALTWRVSLTLPSVPAVPPAAP
jgi:DHA1 family tetracycline resistance protein-like MFS transporter